MRASVLDSLDDFERWNKDEHFAYVFPRGYRRERWSYPRLAAVAYQFARHLQALHISQGDAVLLWSPNCAEWVAAFLGCALCGVIAVPIDDAANPDFARRISTQVRTRLVLCPRERASVFAPVGTPSIHHTAAIPTIDPADLATTVAEHSTKRYRPISIQPSDPLEIVFTSGTTAEPKGVVLTHANVVGNLSPIETEIKKYLRYEPLVHPIRFLNLLPLSHVFGQFLGIFLPPLLGGTVVFENTFNPSAIMATIHRERISVLVAVPRMIESLQQKIERDLEKSAGDATGRDRFNARFAAAKNQHFLRRWFTFRHLRRQFGWKFWAIISGGAALDRLTEEFWHRLGYAVIQGYGLTETTSLISLNHPFHTSRGSIGKVLPGREIKLAEDGEILVRGSGVASAYWNGRELLPVAETDGENAGWYRTGDLGALDQQGNLFFQGRKKEVIVTPAGMNVYPQDLEAVLRQHPEVRDCVVVGLARGGNAEPCAVLILRPPASADNSDLKPVSNSSEPTVLADDLAAEIVAHANQTLADYQRIRRWFLWPDPDFPRSATQKPRRNAIRDAIQAWGAADHTTAPDAHAPSTQALAELVTRITRRPAHNLAPDANLESGLGLTSLERVELLSALEDRYQIDLGETSLTAASTVGDLERLLLLQDRQKAAPAPGLPNEIRTPAFHYPRWTLRWPTTWVRLASHYLLQRPAVFLLGWPRVTGLQNLRAVHGPLLVISNHISDVDFALIQTALPVPIRHQLAIATRGEALEMLRSPAPDPRWFGQIRNLYVRMQWTLGVALLNLFPLPRQSGFRKSFAYAGEAVDRGYSVLVFPEGKHSEDGRLLPFRSGIGLLANNLHIPILPMRIDGLFELKQAHKKFAAPGTIHVHIGRPLQFSPETDPEEIARALQQAVENIPTHPAN
ncbi:MAG: AMP-binding protein [Terriglobales bacterium]